MGMTPQGPDIFTLKKGYIKCVSSSGSIYKVTHDSCSCKGFSFRKLCRHYRQAKSQGLLDDLEVEIEKECKFTKNSHIKKMRIEAIQVFLNKHNIRFTSSHVARIESFLTTNTKLQEIFGFFF